MCNLYTQTTAPEAMRQLFSSLQMPLTFADGIPNLQARDIRITENAPVVRASAGVTGSFELVMRRWSWPGQGGKPVYNFRSDGRSFPSGRCLILADGFYEFTTPADLKQKRKDRWLFTLANGEPFAIAGLIRAVPDIGEAFTMLTIEPGPDIAPYHSRQVAVLPPQLWGDWLGPSTPPTDFLRPLPAGSLRVEAATNL